MNLFSGSSLVSTSDLQKDSEVSGGDRTAFLLRPVYASGLLDEFRIPNGKSSIGSSANCSLRIDQPGVASLHAMLFTNADRVLLKVWDKRSWLNGDPVDESEIHPGDEITIGPIQFLVTEQSGSSFNDFGSEPERDGSKQDSLHTDSDETSGPEADLIGRLAGSYLRRPDDSSSLPISDGFDGLIQSIDEGRTGTDAGMPHITGAELLGGDASARLSEFVKRETVEEDISERDTAEPISAEADQSLDESTELPESLQNRELELARNEQELRRREEKLAELQEEVLRERLDVQALAAQLGDLEDSSREDMLIASSQIAELEADKQALNQMLVDARELQEEVERDRERLAIRQAECTSRESLIQHQEDHQQELQKRFEEERSAWLRDREADWQSRLEREQKALADRQEELDQRTAELSARQFEIEAMNERLESGRVSAEDASVRLAARELAVTEQSLDLERRQQQVVVNEENVDQRQAALEKQEKEFADFKQTVEDREAEIARCLADIERLSGELDERDLNLGSRVENLELKQQELERREERLDAGIQELDARRTELDAIQSGLDAAMDQFEGWSASRETTSPGTDELNAREASVAEEQRRLDELRADFEEANTEFQKQVRELEEYRSELEQRHSQNEERHRELDLASEKLARQTTELEEKTESCKQDQTALEASRVELEQNRQELNELRLDLESRSSGLEDLEMKLEKKHELLEQLRSELDMQAEEIEDKRLSLFRKGELLEELREELEKQADQLNSFDVETPIGSDSPDLIGSSDSEESPDESDPDQAERKLVLESWGFTEDEDSSEILEIADEPALKSELPDEVPSNVGRKLNDQTRFHHVSDPKPKIPMRSVESHEDNSVEKPIGPADLSREETVDSYMERLLNQSRNRSHLHRIQEEPKRKPVVISPAPPQPRQSDQIIGEFEQSNKRIEQLRNQINKEVSREELSTFRELANLTSRSAVAEHAWRRIRSMAVLNGTIAVLSTAMCVGILLTGAWRQVLWAQIGWFGLAICLISLLEVHRAFSVVSNIRKGNLSPSDARSSLSALQRMMSDREGKEHERTVQAIHQELDVVDTGAVSKLEDTITIQFERDSENS